MKFRSSFVSNSSSASFLIAFPKKDPIALKDIEQWLGGYTDDINPEVMDMIGFQFWKTQYFDEEMYRRDFRETGEEYIYRKCSATWNQMQELWSCPKYLHGDNEKSRLICEKCKFYTVEKRIDRADDYYKALDMVYDDNELNWLERHKEERIIYFEVDDNNPARGIDYYTANEITSNAYHLFNHKTDNVYCTGGK